MSPGARAVVHRLPAMAAVVPGQPHDAVFHVAALLIALDGQTVLVANEPALLLGSQHKIWRKVLFVSGAQDPHTIHFRIFRVTAVVKTFHKHGESLWFVIRYARRTCSRSPRRSRPSRLCAAWRSHAPRQPIRSAPLGSSLQPGARARGSPPPRAPPPP